MSCEEVRDAIPQFALDILGSQTRASVAAHLLRCAACRGEVAAAQESADRLLSGTDPFGDGDEHQSWYDEHELWHTDQPEWSDEEACDTLRGLEPQESGVGPTRSRLRMVITIAAAGLLIIGTTFGPELSSSSNSRVVPVAQAQLLTANSQSVGYVYFLGGKHNDIEVQAVGVQGVSRLTLELVGTTGELVRVGQFPVVAGKASWAAPSSLSASDVAEVVILDPAGAKVATALVA